MGGLPPPPPYPGRTANTPILPSPAEQLIVPKGLTVTAAHATSLTAVSSDGGYSVRRSNDDSNNPTTSSSLNSFIKKTLEGIKNNTNKTAVETATSTVSVTEQPKQIILPLAQVNL